MSYSFSIYQSINDLPVNWKEFLNENEKVCNSIEIVEKAHVDNIQNYYVVTKENNEIVYMSYFQLLNVTPKHFNISDKPLQKFGLYLLLKTINPTMLVAGNLFRHDVLFFQVVDKKTSPEKIAAYYQATLDHMIKETDASGIFLKDVKKNIAPFILKDLSYTPLQDDISMEMKIPSDWTSMLDYEKMLKHKYAQRYRKIKKAFHGVTIKEFSLQDIEVHKTEIVHLYLQVSKKQIVSMGIINDHFIIELKKALENNYKVCGYFFENKLVAFSSAIEHDGEYDMNYIGFDYALNNQLNLYFNILFHCIEMAIAHKSSKLILGRTAIEAKAIAGCAPDYRFSFYKLRNNFVNWFFKKISTYFQEQQGEAWKNRHPFKSEYYGNA
jgi:hypothetical protein